MSDERPAPNRLDLTMDFVNTANLDTGREDLADPAALAGWLQERDLPVGAGALDAEDLEAALTLREALRAAMLVNNGGERDAGAEARIEAAARRGELSVSFEQGQARIAPRAGGFAGALAALLVPVADSMADGTWSRVKACRADDCQWAFYDFSRNRSGTWCDMAICGNREKVRAYRRRTPRAAADGAG
jgi:predicted RNA-binding Zn ribbon-like protein